MDAILILYQIDYPLAACVRLFFKDRFQCDGGSLRFFFNVL